MVFGVLSAATLCVHTTVGAPLTPAGTVNFVQNVLMVAPVGQVPAVVCAIEMLLFGRRWSPVSDAGVLDAACANSPVKPSVANAAAATMSPFL